MPLRGKIATDINEDLETSVCSEFISFDMLSNMLYINTAQKFVVGKIFYVSGKSLLLTKAANKWLKM